MIDGDWLKNRAIDYLFASLIYDWYFFVQFKITHFYYEECIVIHFSYQRIWIYLCYYLFL